MNKSFALAVLLLLASCSGPDFASFVDPIIGSDGHGHVFVGASVPFGMVQLGPTQPTRGWDWCSGYAYRDSVVLGFSHTHLSGTGIGDLGDICFLPFNPSKRKYTSGGHLYGRLDHALETVEPGYYALSMPDLGVDVRLTAGTYTGYHEYTFKSDTSAVLVDLKLGIGWDRVTDYKIEVIDDYSIKGYRYSTGWAEDQKVYFYAIFSMPFTGGDEGIFFFDTSTQKKLYAAVSLSPTSEQKAIDNLAYDTRKGNNFEKNVAFARGEWNKALGKIKVKPMDDAQRQIFYTSLYHSMIAPSRFSDATGPERYTVFSLWDAYRAAFPLYTLIEPERCRNFAESFMDIYESGGELPVWHLWGNETYCMPGNPGVIIMGDLVLKGLYDEPEKALEAMFASSKTRARGQQDILDYGFIPYDGSEPYESVSKALEFAVSYSSVAKVAELLGHAYLASEYFEKSKLYARYFDAESGFLRAKAKDGSFRCPLDPFRAEHQRDDYTEGNAWQWTFMVPHDTKGLIELFGGERKFLCKLDSLFVAEGDMGENHDDVTGLIGQYAHGNEPVHHVAYMYNVAGKPERCAEVVRNVMDSLYTTGPEGLCGNEDVGQMSAWYVLSALGIYQLDPCGGDFYIGSPAVRKAVLNLTDPSTGKKTRFTIVARGNSPKNIYVKSARLNGKALETPFISYSQIVKGGRLVLEMGDN
ncbi:MAG: GH92 family glycosyl hydrolase [Candidatus Cryptobacteroides sp.]|jgi:putative alpha-1,2-mannosidase|nr:glycoside hydrolase family 92 protein [Rikenellaceae bacterium]